MASIQKTSKGYRAQIKLLGVRDSKVFRTRREATEWAAKREAQIRDTKETPQGERHTLLDALRRYADEVSPTKRGARWEAIRLTAFERMNLPLDKPIAHVTSADIAAFRDSRGMSVKSSSVLRELTLLTAVFEMARLEWGWIAVNPCRDIRRPRAPKHRERVIQWWEVKAMLRELDYPLSGPIETKKQAIAVCFLVALRTGMRAGELCNLTWDHVHEHHVHLPTTKSGKARDVPLSSMAKRSIERMRGCDDSLVFGLTASSLDAMFRKHRGRAGLSGFTWHDSRHTAATMLSKKVDVLDLCKIFGWGDPRFALVYYNPHASQIAALLG